MALFIGSLLMVSCNDGKGIGNERTGAVHSAHRSSASSDREVKGIEVNGGNIADTSLTSAVAAANRVVLSDQASVAARSMDTSIIVTTNGYITWDVRRNKKISARTGGRVERLFVKYNNQFVRRGEKIMELYTPEINTYAAEYLHHFTTSGDEVLASKSKEKLQLLGITEQQIKQLEKTGYISNSLPVYSNATGFVLFDTDTNAASSGMSDGNESGGAMGGDMDGGNSPSQTSFRGVNAQTQLREGMYVNRGQTLFYVNDFTIAWGVLSFDEAIQPLLKSGMTVILKSELLDLPIRSTISFIEPSFNNASQRFMQVRTYLPNNKRKLKVNSLIEGTVNIALQRQVMIPSNAVFSLGKRKIVWVKVGTTVNGKNIFEARDIQISLMNKDVAVVTKGLSDKEEVAADAGYLLDSQSLIEQ